MDKVLFDKVQSDYPELRFMKGRKFLYRPPKTIIVGPDEPNDSLLLLHEVGHALCGHHNFHTQIERLRMEREAWEKAKEICGRYGVVYDETAAEQELDTYREYLDKKSRCPKCGLTRFQDASGKYYCPACDL